MTQPEQAVVLLSGGLDSATCLAMARADGLDCHALSIDYGQRHRTELEALAAWPPPRACRTTAWSGSI